MNFLRVLQKPRPKLLLQLLLPQNHLNILGSMINLALLFIDFSVKLKFQMVCLL